MKQLKILVTAVAVTCLPVAMGGQKLWDLGDYGAAVAKNNDKGNSGNSGKGGSSNKGGNSGKDKSDNGNSGKGKSDNGNSGKDKSDRGNSGKSGSSKAGKSKSGGAGKDKAVARSGKNPMAQIGNIFKKKSVKTVKVAKSKPKKVTAKKKLVQKKSVRAAALAVGAAGGAALNSDLKSLNSLNRNVNGLVNGKDPKMDPIREYIAASVEYEDAVADRYQAALDARASLAAFKTAVDLVGLEGETREELLADYQDKLAEHAANEVPEPVEPTPPPEGTPTDSDEYQQYLADLEQYNTVDKPAYDAWVEEGENLATVETAAGTLEEDLKDLEEANRKVEETGDAASREALQEAMAESLNAASGKGLTAEDMTEEMTDWVEAKLGVGDKDGLIDDYRDIMDAADGNPGDGTTDDDLPLDDADAGDAGDSPDGEPPIIVASD